MMKRVTKTIASSCFLWVGVTCNAEREFPDDAINRLDADSPPGCNQSGGRLVSFHFKTLCPVNTFFVDWGSSGMKVLAVHAKSYKGKSFQDVPVNMRIPEEFPVHVGLERIDCIPETMSELARKLAVDHLGGVVTATAGFRERPIDAHHVWEDIAKWNAVHKLFQECDSDDHDGCKTLPGSEEGQYEAMALVSQVLHPAGPAQVHLQEAISKGKFGMLSCGGASLQMVIAGSDENMTECANAFSALDNDYDRKRIRKATLQIQGSNVTVLSLSWLAVHTAGSNFAGDKHDYMVGGLNEMRARFDSFVRNTTPVGTRLFNPCVSDITQGRDNDVCMQYSGLSSCVFDRYHGYMTALDGAPVGQKAVDQADAHRVCRKKVQEFLSKDLMLSIFERCAPLVNEPMAWGLITSFSREDQFGVKGLQSGMTMGTLRERMDSGDGHWEMNYDNANWDNTHWGKELTSMLLQEFVKKVSIPEGAWVQAVDHAEVANAELAKWHFFRGWLQEEECMKVADVQVAQPAVTKTGSPPSKEEHQQPNHEQQQRHDDNATAAAAAAQNQHPQEQPPSGQHDTAVKVAASQTCERCSRYKLAPSAAHGTVASCEEATPGAVLQVTCANYTAKVWRIHCSTDGSWGSEDGGLAPDCHIAPCGTPPTVELGAWRQSRHLPPGLVELVCLDGYMPRKGPGTLRCRMNDVGSFGEWEVASTVCAPGGPTAGSGDHWRGALRSSGGLYFLVLAGFVLCVLFTRREGVPVQFRQAQQGPSAGVP